MRRFQRLVVDAVNHGRIHVFLARRGNDHFLGTAGQMRAGLSFAGEQAGAFKHYVDAVLATSRNPLSDEVLALLAKLSAQGKLGMDEAKRLLPAMLKCFARHHDLPTLAQYEMLKAESAEMAWISTEGNAFNHATDRVSDVVATAERQSDMQRVGQLEHAIDHDQLLLYGQRIVPVDDRSEDRTGEIAAERGAIVLRREPGEEPGRLPFRVDSG